MSAIKNIKPAPPRLLSQREKDRLILSKIMFAVGYSPNGKGPIIILDGGNNKGRLTIKREHIPALIESLQHLVQHESSRRIACPDPSRTICDCDNKRGRVSPPVPRSKDHKK